jgi:hypothetical protein
VWPAASRYTSARRTWWARSRVLSGVSADDSCWSRFNETVSAEIHT